MTYRPRIVRFIDSVHVTEGDKILVRF
jgi:hypothetical protein